MKLYTPQVQLFYDLVLDGPNEYYLHAVTFCDRTNLREAGHLIHEIDADSKTVIIDLFVEEVPDLPSFSSLTPIVHTVSLGAAPFEGDGLFETRLMVKAAVSARSDTPPPQAKGRTTSSTTSAKEVDRPFDDIF